MGRSFVSLRPVFDQPRAINSRVKDTAGIRNAEHLQKGVIRPRFRTALKRSPSAHRVEKLGAKHKKRKRGGAMSLGEHFKHTIETYRDAIASEIDHQLDETEKDLEDQLADITSEFGGRLKIVAEHEDDIFRSIADERLEITTLSPDKNGESCKQQASLAERVGIFEHTVSREEAHLARLWEKWHETQLELVCLAVEILGPDAVSLPQDQQDSNMAVKIGLAMTTYRERQAYCRCNQEKTAEWERSIQTTAGNTVRSLHDQEKEWKANEKKKIQRIKQIMMEAD